MVRVHRGPPSRRARDVRAPPSRRIAKLSLVDSQTFHDRLERWYKALNARNFDDLGALMADIADKDIVLDYPQSGERVRGRENNLAILENYPGLPDATVKKVHGAGDKWVLTPSWTPLRIAGSGDHYSVEGRLAYPSGEVWNFVDIFALRNEKVVTVTEYFAAPFPPAEWRAKWVEKIESPSR